MLHTLRAFQHVSRIQKDAGGVATGGAISTVDLQAGGLLRPEQGGRSGISEMNRRRKLRKPVLLGKSCSELGKAFDESQHPRDDHGKFTERGQELHQSGSGSVVSGDNHRSVINPQGERGWSQSTRNAQSHALVNESIHPTKEAAEQAGSDAVFAADKVNPAPPVVSAQARLDTMRRNIKIPLPQSEEAQISMAKPYLAATPASGQIVPVDFKTSGLFTASMLSAALSIGDQNAKNTIRNWQAKSLIAEERKVLQRNSRSGFVRAVPTYRFVDQSESEKRGVIHGANADGSNRL